MFPCSCNIEERTRALMIPDVTPRFEFPLKLCIRYVETYGYSNILHAPLNYALSARFAFERIICNSRHHKRISPSESTLSNLFYECTRRLIVWPR